MANNDLTQKEVQHVAKLARLKLSGEELEQMHTQLTSILSYVDRLSAIDTEKVSPTFHAVPLDAPLRPDEVQPGLRREEALAIAPAISEGGFAVPKVLDV